MLFASSTSCGVALGQKKQRRSRLAPSHHNNGDQAGSGPIACEQARPSAAALNPHSGRARRDEVATGPFKPRRPNKVFSGDDTAVLARERRRISHASQ